jgi:hypothetical protein
MRGQVAKQVGVAGIAWSAVLACAACAVIAAPAFAADLHAFDPVLSLTGGCGVSKLDEVPDPGCPEENHEPGTFDAPRAVTTDFYGNIFISSGSGEAGRIDVFDPAGFFIAQVLVPSGPRALAVDSEGNLYVVNAAGELRRYEPSLYEPKAGKLEYEAEPVLVVKGSFDQAIAINVKNDRLFVYPGGAVKEYSSAAEVAASEGNKLLDGSIGDEDIQETAYPALAVDAAHGRIYVSESGATVDSTVKVFDLESPHELLLTVDGAEVPAKKFNRSFSLAADEGTGHFFVYDGEEAKAVYEFTEAGEYLGSIKHGFIYSTEHKIGVDNGPFSPNGALNPLGRHLFVPSHPSGEGHVFAFGPEEKECAAEVESLAFSDVTETEAELQAEVEPCGLETTYVFEYTTLQSFEEEGFEGAQVAGEGQLPAGATPVSVSASATGLSPDTAYRFRLVAANGEGSEEEEGEFRTYPVNPLGPCPNDALRTGFSEALPDCRAYELVTPPDTNARTPRGVGHLGVYFTTREASPAGDKVSFLTEGGSIPGNEGTGSFAGDPYLSTRTEEGWGTAAAGPTGAEAAALLPGSTSPDQGYSFWRTAGGEGSAAIEEKSTSYVRYPDGHSELVGRGGLADDPFAAGRLISENGGHIVFVSGVGGFSALRLEENAPPDGTRTIYDRTSDEVTHVVSLLPGEETPAAGQDASYVGASLDGEGVAFEIGGALYLRFDDEETYEIGAGVTFAGVSEGGGRIFYVEGGDLYAFDVAGEKAVQFSESGDVTVVNVASDGTAAYLVSPSVLSGEENPQGVVAKAGKENLYLSEEGQISFVGIVTERDVEGEFVGIELAEGLGLWTKAVGPYDPETVGKRAIDPSRTTPDGGVLLFESRANLTGYDPGGHAEVYRYDSAGSLQCLSCNPTLAPASGEASLQSISQGIAAPEPLSSFGLVNNLSLDGRRAFFQSEEPLVVDDTDGLQDVYEWEAQGVGSCKRAGGCVYLISSGHSDRLDYIYAASDTGDDVFFRSSDLLLGIDVDRTPSIYDARVGGGFPEAEDGICEGEGCKPVITPSPSLPAPAAPALGVDDNVPPAKTKRCPKGKRKVKRAGKVRCVKKHHKKRRHKPSSSNQGGSK